MPLAVVLWSGGISFGGVISFIFADLLILPILNIYRKYYGLKMAAVMTGVFYVAMVGAGYVVELLFTPAGLTPDRAIAHLPDAGITWNYTTWLNIAFPILAALLAWRFFRTDGRQMLAMMGGAPTTETQHQDPPPATDEAAQRPGHSGNHHQHPCGEKNGK